MTIGTVKWFNMGKGYGFIAPESLHWKANAETRDAWNSCPVHDSPRSSFATAALAQARAHPRTKSVAILARAGHKSGISTGRPGVSASSRRPSCHTPGI